MSKNPLRKNFQIVLDSIGVVKFTTMEFIDRLKSNYSADWEDIVKKYGEGGKGSGNSYSSFSFVGQALKGFSDKGLLFPVGWVDAPKVWGSGIIRVWQKGNNLSKSLYSSAIDDVNQSDDENDDPKYLYIMEESRGVVRDYNVRSRVLKRAKGLCEYGSIQLDEAKCNTFIKRDGNSYLEAHHILKLSDAGKDEDSNVIAICANHHREAHSGKNWEALNEKFQEIVDEKMRS